MALNETLAVAALQIILPIIIEKILNVEKNGAPNDVKHNVVRDFIEGLNLGIKDKDLFIVDIVDLLRKHEVFV